jgi:hypothetical protein
MPSKNNNNNTQNTKPITTSKFTRTYEDEDMTEVWVYDTNKTTHGPVSVDIKYKNGYDKQRNWNKRAKIAKEERRIKRQMSKISENNAKQVVNKRTSSGKSKRGRPKRNGWQAV